MLEGILESQVEGLTQLLSILEVAYFILTD